MNRIALVVPALMKSGGVATVADFLYRVLEQHPDFAPELVSIPASSSDPSSTQLRSPKTWWQGIQVEEGMWRGRPYTKVGAKFVEFEFQRYSPRRELTRRLNQHDLVQVIAGSPAWAYSTRDVNVPVALQVATLVEVERKTKERSLLKPIEAWRQLMTRVTSRIERKSLSYIDAVFVENDWMHQWMQERIPSQKVIFAPPGIDETFFRPASELNRENNYLLSVGRFGDSRKNVSLLFSAYARIRDEIPDAPPLVLAGKTPPKESAWEHAQSLGIRDSVEFRENVSSEELAELYRQASLFLLSSNEEGLGLVILEAMASGIPVVSTDCGGPSTLIKDGETGYLVPVKDDKALASPVTRLLQNAEERERMGMKGRERVERLFSQNAAGRRFIRTYQSLLDSE